MTIKEIMRKVKIFMLDRVNLFIEQQKLKEKQANLTKFNEDLVVQLIDRMNTMISILNEIKEKQLNTVISVSSSDKEIKVKENERPFIPTIDTSRANIQASDIQKRTRKVDLKDSVTKLKQINNE